MIKKWDAGFLWFECGNCNPSSIKIMETNLSNFLFIFPIEIELTFRGHYDRQS